MGRPGDQPLPGVHDGMADADVLHHRRGRADRAARPSVLEAAGVTTSSPWPNLAITTAVILVMLVIAVAGIRLTARTQILVAVVEYAILVGLAIAGLVIVLRGHHPGAVPVSSAWLSPTGIGGKGSITGAFLISAFVIAGWDGTMYVNEEVRHRRIAPGRAAVLAAGLLAVLYTLIQVGLQGVVSPSRLRAHSTSVLVYTVQSFAGNGWGRVMATAIALSVIATTGVGIVLTARIMYGMASWRALPAFLANVSRRYSTPVAASVLTGALLLVLVFAYVLGTSMQNAFNDLLAISAWLTVGFYMFTAMAMTAYYRRQVFAKFSTAVTVGLLPLASVVFLGWVLVRSIQAAPWPQKWSLIGVLGAGVVLMFTARFIWRSPFFGLARESQRGARDRAQGHGEARWISCLSCGAAGSTSAAAAASGRSQRIIENPGDDKADVEGQVGAVERARDRSHDDRGVHERHHGSEAEHESHDRGPSVAKIAEYQRTPQERWRVPVPPVMPVNHHDRAERGYPVADEQQDVRELSGGIARVHPEDCRERQHRHEGGSDRPLHPGAQRLERKRSGVVVHRVGRDRPEDDGDEGQHAQGPAAHQRSHAGRRLVPEHAGRGQTDRPHPHVRGGQAAEGQPENGCP